MSDTMNSSDPNEDELGTNPNENAVLSGDFSFDSSGEEDPEDSAFDGPNEEVDDSLNANESVEETPPLSHNEGVVGPDLRADLSSDAIYYKLRDARSAARTIERANTAKNSEELAPNPHWKKIMEWAPLALEQSKDLEIAAWYTEALLREENFAGLAKGFALLTDLVTQYGQKLYPAFDEEEGLLDSTLAPLVSLNGSGSTPGTLISPINCVLITHVNNGPNFAIWQYTQSLNLARAPNEKVRQERIKQGVPTMDTLMAAAKATPSDFSEPLSAELNSAIQNFQSLTEALDKQFGHDSPPSTHIKAALSVCRKALQSLNKDKLIKDVKGQSELAASGSDMHQEASEEKTLSLSSTDTQENRKNAIDSLRNLADFFKRTEPHSPIGYTLERAVRWSGMELPALLREFILDPHVQTDVGKTTGVPIELPRVAAPAPNNPAAPAYDYGGGYNPSAPGGGGGFDPYANPAQQPGGFGGAPAYDPAGMGGNNFGGGGLPPGSGGGGFGNNSF
jgi:type VI secretion system protein ImpA